MRRGGVGRAGGADVGRAAGGLEGGWCVSAAGSGVPSGTAAIDDRGGPAEAAAEGRGWGRWAGPRGRGGGRGGEGGGGGGGRHGADECRFGGGGGGRCGRRNPCGRGGRCDRRWRHNLKHRRS